MATVATALENYRLMLYCSSCVGWEEERRVTFRVRTSSESKKSEQALSSARLPFIILRFLVRYSAVRFAPDPLRAGSPRPTAIRKMRP